MAGKSLSEARIRLHTGATVVAIKRADGQTLVSPDPEITFAAKDTLILVGEAGVSSRLDSIENNA